MNDPKLSQQSPVHTYSYSFGCTFVARGEAVRSTPAPHRTLLGSSRRLLIFFLLSVGL